MNIDYNLICIDLKKVVDTICVLHSNFEFDFTAQHPKAIEWAMTKRKRTALLRNARN